MKIRFFSNVILISSLAAGHGLFPQAAAQIKMNAPVLTLETSEGGGTFAATAAGVFRIRGTAAQALTPGELVFEQFAFAATDQSRVYAVSSDRLLGSKDGGVTWSALATPNYVVPIGTLAVSTRDRDLLWVSRSNLLWRSSDGGSTWKQLGNPNTWSVSRIAATDNGRVFMATTGDGIYVSENNGDTWQPRSAGLPKGMGTAPVIAIEDFAADPTNSNKLYAATSFYGVYRSEDGGQTWKASNSGLPVPLRMQTTGVALLRISRFASNVQYLSMSVPVHSRRTDHSIFKSTDGGLNWFHLKDANPENKTVLSLAVDALNPNGIYLGTGDGVVIRLETEGSR